MIETPVSDDGCVVVPEAIRQALQWQDGDTVCWAVLEGGHAATLRKLPNEPVQVTEQVPNMPDRGCSGR